MRATRKVLVLPVPPRELSPNARPDRFGKAEQTKLYRVIVAARARESGVDLIPTPCVLHLHYYLKKKHDADNLTGWWKSGLDGLCDAGLIPGDGPEYVKYIYATQERTKGEESLEVTWEHTSSAAR